MNTPFAEIPMDVDEPETSATLYSNQTTISNNLLPLATLSSSQTNRLSFPAASTVSLPQASFYTVPSQNIATSSNY